MEVAMMSVVFLIRRLLNIVSHFILQFRYQPRHYLHLLGDRHLMLDLLLSQFLNDVNVLADVENLHVVRYASLMSFGRFDQRLICFGARSLSSWLLARSNCVVESIYVVIPSHLVDEDQELALGQPSPPGSLNHLDFEDDYPPGNNHLVQTVEAGECVLDLYGEPLRPPVPEPLDV